MRQHQELGLGICCGPDCRTCQPRIADLAGVGRLAAVPRMARRPRPPLQVKKTGRTDDRTVLHADNCKWYGSASVTPSNGGFNVLGGLDFALRDWTPLVERAINRRSGCQAVNVAVVKRFETNVRARQHRIFCSHVSSMQCVTVR